MGRYPFLAAANEYMALMQGVLKPSTWREYERRYRRMDQDMQALVRAGKIATTNPKKLTDRDVLLYLASLRARGMADSGVSHNIDALASLLRFVGNGALDKAKMTCPQHFPRYARMRLDPLEARDRAAIIKAANATSDKDLRQMVAYGFAVAGICTGLRPGELRLAKISDLDLKRGTLHAEEVKGKDRYGEPRTAAIQPDGLPFLRRYVKARAAAVAKKGSTNDALFPTMCDWRDGDGVYSQQGLSRLREIVSKETGVVFDGRACRRTYGQTSIDEGVPLDAVSRMLGHRTTKTTETYYARRTNEAAINEAQKIWDRQPKPIEINSPLIDKRNDRTGYA